MSTTTIPTGLAHDIVARLLQDRDTTAREQRTRLIACMADATSPGLDELPEPAPPALAEVTAWRESIEPAAKPASTSPGLVRPFAEPASAASLFVADVEQPEWRERFLGMSLRAQAEVLRTMNGPFTWVGARPFEPNNPAMREAVKCGCLVACGSNVWVRQEVAELEECSPHVEPAANTPELDGEPEREPSLLTLEIFADGERAETWDATQPPREREIIILAGYRYRVALIEWHTADIVHVHTQALLRLPAILDDGGAF